MIVTNGGKVFSPRGWIGDRGYPDGGRYGQRNAVVVSGAGSVWSNSTEAVVVGQRGLSNLVSVANGGALYAPLIALGYQASASNNAAVVAGAGSVLATPTIYVGSKGANSRMTATNSGTVRSSNVIFVGTDPTSTSNWLTVAGGKLYVTNSSGAALLDVRRGTLFIQGSGGACVADRLNLNVAAGVLKFVAAADGVTRIAVNSALTVDPTKAALIVDVAAYQTRYGPELTLVQYGSMSAPFTDVTISGLAGREVRFSQSAGNRITLTFLPAGTLMEIQ
jgi:T5SS/PEP-CTERM-associated repeat protein